MKFNTIYLRLLFFFGILFVCIPVTAYSNEAVGWYMKGINLTNAGNYTDAIQVYDKALTLEPNYFEAWNGKADVLNRAHLYDQALEASNHSLEINPTYVNGWIYRGQILYNIGYKYEDQIHDINMANMIYEEQLQAFEKAIEIDPNNAEAWFNKGYALAGMKRYDEAISAFNKVATLDPLYPNLQANLQIAEKLRDASIPFYMKYAPVILVVMIFGIGAIIWLKFKRKSH